MIVGRLSLNVLAPFYTGNTAHTPQCSVCCSVTPKRPNYIIGNREYYDRDNKRIIKEEKTRVWLGPPVQCNCMYYLVS